MLIMQCVWQEQTGRIGLYLIILEALFLGRITTYLLLIKLNQQSNALSLASSQREKTSLYKIRFIYQSERHVSGGNRVGRICGYIACVIMPLTTIGRKLDPMKCKAFPIRKCLNWRRINMVNIVFINP